MISILGISSALLVVSEKGSKVVIESNACGDIKAMLLIDT